ncbi:hypothetical protein LCGC14_0814970 [marine sediment metagenome]|uniref:Uncharacterized protein n=1 Tax=marine sediment metagenome TaxID=412755 RepID=A0A0F9Q5X8_9ZZZZ
MKLTDEEMKRVKESLCTYDKRSPYFDEKFNEERGDCYCDSCFRGQAWMAELILKLIREE